MLRSTYSPLLGTTIKLAVSNAAWRSEKRATDRIASEIRRLSDVFNVFAPLSAISRLAESGSTNSPELLELLAIAEQWQLKSENRFDAKIGTADVNLNAIAKGWIVDRAAERAGKTASLMIDAGGDVMYRGAGSILVGIEHPLRPYDNQPPIMVINLADAAVATSGFSHRGDHLIDPRTGESPTAIASASVVAADAATADVVATILAVGQIAEGLALGQTLGLAVGLVDPNGQLHRNEKWRAIEAQSI